MKALRNVLCLICGRRRPERESLRVTVNRQPAWLCRRCSTDPEAGRAERQAAMQRPVKGATNE